MMSRGCLDRVFRQRVFRQSLAIHAQFSVHVIRTGFGDHILKNIIERSSSGHLDQGAVGSLWNHVEPFVGQQINQGCIAKAGRPRYHMPVRQDPERS